MKTDLVFVYNADSGVFNALSDLAHKVFSPETYQCNLCALTYSSLGMRNDWKEFLESLDRRFEFLHRDEWKKRYGMKSIDLPAIFTCSNDRLEIWIDSESLNACRNLEDLKNMIRKKSNGNEKTS